LAFSSAPSSNMRRIQEEFCMATLMREAMGMVEYRF
jgi:hypothetical protein